MKQMSKAFLALLNILVVSHGLPSINYQPYNETIARKMLDLAAAAYSDEPHVCLMNRFERAEIVQRYELFCDSSMNATCSAYLALLHEENAIVISFRGTKDDVQFYREVLSGVETKQRFYGFGKVNKYFRDAYLTLWLSGMSDLFYEMVNFYPGYSVWVTGHSLGGALATLASADLISTGKFNTHNSLHYNFGCPRVGDEHFAEIFQKLLPDYFRIVHAQDAITTVFPTLLGYRHHHTQIWYNNNMTDGDQYIVCYGDNDPRCPVRPSMSMFDHRRYFNVRVPVYGHHGCVGNGEDKIDETRR